MQLAIEGVVERPAPLRQRASSPARSATAPTKAASTYSIGSKLLGRTTEARQ